MEIEVAGGQDGREGRRKRGMERGAMSPKKRRKKGKQKERRGGMRKPDSRNGGVAKVGGNASSVGKRAASAASADVASTVDGFEVHDDFSLEEDGDREGVMVYEEAALGASENTAIVDEMKLTLGDILTQCATFRF